VPNGASLEIGSYGDRATIDRVLRDHDVEVVLHCAAKSIVGESVVDPGRYFRENVAGGVALLDALVAARIERFVFSSTASVYGIPQSTPITEEAVTQPINPYGESKRIVESMLRWYGEAHGLRSVTLRYFNVAGATREHGEAHDPETHLIPNIFRAVLEDRPLTIFGDDYPTRDGTCIRDYLHVSDLADAHRRAIAATAPGDPRTASGPVICNLGNGSGFSNREVLDAAIGVLDRSIDHTVGPRRDGDPPTLVASAIRAGEVLGWTPAHPSIEDIVASAWEWQQHHPDGYEG
jgi:UDP-glucose 4-epimerase